MMRFLFDTNILVAYLRSAPLSTIIENELNITNSQNIVMISSVTKGELMAFALNNNWGEKRKEKLNELLNKIFILDINASDNALFEAYAEIDSYSQNKLLNQPLPQGQNAVKMSKNDLWIAATTKISGATLITTDGDFDHLRTKINLIKYKPDGTRVF